MEKRSQRKVLMLILAACMVVMLSAGMTLAYFSDYEEASGGATLKLGGETEMTEGNDSTDKHIVVENTGETDMITRVMIFDNDYMEVTLEKADDWEEKAIDGGKCYYYRKILGAGEKTSAIDAKLSAEWTGEEPEYDFDVTVIHESARAVYNGETLVTPEGWDDISGVISTEKESA